MYHACQDIIEYLMTTTGGGAQDSEHRALRSAAGNAYRDLINVRDWAWYNSAVSLDSDELKNAGRVILPADCKNVDALIPPDRSTPCVFVNLKEYLQLMEYDSSAGSTIWWTVRPSGEVPGSLDLLIGGREPPIYENQPYVITYRRSPPPLRYMGYEKGCRDQTINPDGCVRRYGTPTNFPEGPHGIHPFTAEEIIGQPGSLVGNPPVGARTVVSDYLDIGDYMLSALLSGAEAWYARLTGKNVEGAMTVHNRDLRLAMEVDGLAPMSGRRRDGYRYPEGVEMPYAATATARAMGYYSPSGPDTGTLTNP